MSKKSPQPPTLEQRITDLAKSLSANRGVPQLIFISGIYTESFLKLRETVNEYKDNGGNMDEIDFVLQSPGGIPDDGYRIIRFLRESFKEVNFVIPFWAKSAATLMTLGGSRIIMGYCGELGPLDMQLGVAYEDRPGFDRESALTDDFSLRQLEERSIIMPARFFNFVFQNEHISINKDELFANAIEFYSSFYQPLLDQIDPYKIGKKARILAIGREYAYKIMRQYCPQVPSSSRQQLIKYLVDECPDHGFSVDYHTLKPYLSHVIRPEEISEDYGRLIVSVTDLFLKLSSDINFIHLESVATAPTTAATDNSNVNTSTATNGTSPGVAKTSQVTKNEKHSKAKSSRTSTKPAKP